MSILDDLAVLWEMMSKPHPTTIWVVDRPDLEHWLKRSFMNNRPIFWVPGNYYSPCGMVLLTWWTSAEREGDFKPDLFFLNAPHAGVWVEMSDGNHYQIKIGE